MSLSRRWRFLLLSAVAVAGLIALAACSSSDDKSQTTAPSGASGVPTDMAPDAQQIFRWNTDAEPGSLDPQGMAYNYEITFVNNAYLRLLDQDAKTGELTPLGAAEVPTTANGGISADGLTITVKLKSGLKWSDGSPLTAADFVYGIIRGYNLKISGCCYGGFITGIKGAKEALALDSKSATYEADVQDALKDNVVAVNATTIKILLARPSASFLYNLFLPITAAVSKANVEALGSDFGTAAGASRMLTSGPFTYKEWVPKDHVTLARNENYTAGHKAYLREVTATLVEDSNQAYNAFQAGQLDQVLIPPAIYPTLLNDPGLVQEEEFGNRWIQVDVTLPPWDNKDFVIGINQATDKDAIGRDVYFGKQKGYSAFCAPAVVACDPSLFSNLDFNLEKANASIKKAFPNGNIPEVKLDTLDDPTSKNLSTTIQTQWKKVGVTVNITVTDQKTLRANLKQHKSGTQITGWSMDFADPTDLWSVFTIPQIGANNLGFYSREAYDTLEGNQDKELDVAKRKPLLKQVQEFLAADPPVIHLGLRLRTDIVKPNVKGHVKSPYDYIRVGDQFLSEIYISK